MRAGEVFCIPSSFLFLPFGACCILPVCFGLTFRRSLFFIYKFTCAFTYIKKKNLFNCQYLDRFANLLMVKVADFSYNFIILI